MAAKPASSTLSELTETAYVSVRWENVSALNPSPPEPRMKPKRENQNAAAIVGRSNLVVEADNLWFLRAYKGALRGRFKLAYLDPPYNTGNRFTHYDDRRSSDDWRDFMRARLEALRPLMREDGVVVVQINDDEQAYLQVLMDDVFGRALRLNTVVVKMSELSGVKMTHAGPKLPRLKEYLLVYGRSAKSQLRALRVPKPAGRLERYMRYYTKIIENYEAPVREWKVVSVRDYLKRHQRSASKDAMRAFKIRERHRVVYRTNNAFLAGLRFDQEIVPVTSPTGREYVWWNGREMLFLEDHCMETLGDLWTDISTINLNKEGVGRFRNGKKPEFLLRRILEMTTEPGDWVLDPFGGSGTTAAVAHKMRRQWVTIERGEQCRTHIVPRIERVIANEDPSGVTLETGWEGGGEFEIFSAHG